MRPHRLKTARLGDQIPGDADHQRCQHQDARQVRHTPESATSRYARVGPLVAELPGCIHPQFSGRVIWYSFGGSTPRRWRTK